MIGATLVLDCQHVDCEAHEEVDANYSSVRVGELIEEEAPGWGWDFAGLDSVLHCPDHRTTTTKGVPA